MEAETGAIRPRAKGHRGPERLRQAERPRDTWISEVWPQNQGDGPLCLPVCLGQACVRNGHTAQSGTSCAFGSRRGGRP